MPVAYYDLTYDQAKQEIDRGEIIALFGEKYGDTVRVLDIGNPSTSRELCGGTHVTSTGEIGLFVVIGDSSIGTGLRRIEAVTGRGAEAYIEQRIEVLDVLAEDMKSQPLEVAEKVKALMAELSSERKRSAELERKLSKGAVEDLLDRVEQVHGVTVLAATVPSSSIPVLREMGDALREKLQSAVIVLGTVHDNKPGFVAMVTPDLTKKGLHAGNIVKRVAEVTGGGGGGKAEVAQAGGKDKARIEEAIGLVKSLVQNAN
jgi:alanyl-tRNA synthetase